MRIVTPFTELFGIDLPIVQAPIGGAATPELAAAVGNAGGLGLLSLTWHDAETARGLLQQTRALTDRPFGVNFVLDWDPGEKLALALAGGARLVSFFWGDPSAYIPAVHAAGALVAVTVGTAAEAVTAVAAGADVVVAQGWEAGGHVWGNVASLPLIPAVVDAVPGTPVVAAGGIADGRGLAAALTLGASAGWLGTRFVLSSESQAHPLHRDRLLAAAAEEAVHTSLFDGGWPNAPLRALRNSTVRAWEDAGAPPPGERPNEGEIVGHNALGVPVARYSSDGPLLGASGDIEAMVLYGGQSAGAIHDVLPAGEIVRRIGEEAAAALRRAHGLVST